MKKKCEVILIGGAPTVGKSTIAEQLANYLGVPWISTDQIRDILRTIAKKEDFPKFFNSGYTAEKFLAKFSAPEIVQREIEQAEITWRGIKKLIEEDYNWEKGFVIEGVAILPELVAKYLKDNARIKVVFLVDEDYERMRKVIFTRGLWDNAHAYSDDVKEKEVEWAQLFNQKIKRDASKYGFPLVKITKAKTDLKAVLKALKK